MAYRHSQPEDARALTALVAAGDEGAFTRFYESWYGPTLALVRAVSRRDEAWCLDVVQDVMMVVADRLPRLADDDQLRAWMTRTVVRAVTDRCRSEARRRRREREVAEQADSLQGEPWRGLLEQERLQWLLSSVADLSANEQALLQARFGGAATVTAAAATLGMTADAAHGRLRRAIDKLRQMAAEVWRNG